MAPRRKRYKLLLDEMFPRREKYPNLNNFHDLKHVVHDFKKEEMSDIQVLKLAKSEGRILVTKNIKHFKSIIKMISVDVIGVTEILLPEELDKLIMAKLKKWKTIKMSGRFVKIVRILKK